MIWKKWKSEFNENKKVTCNQIGCQFSSNSMDELKNHYLTCNFTPKKVKKKFLQSKTFNKKKNIIDFSELFL